MSGHPSSLQAGGNLNMTDILAMVGQMSSDQQEEFFRIMGYQLEDEALCLIGVNPTANGTEDYEQKMMCYTEYRAHKLLQLYIPPIIIFLGTFGNIFAFVILKNKAMLKFSTYFFLMVMAVADTLVLFAGLLPVWVGQLTGTHVRDLSDWTCKLSQVVGSTVSDYSVWLIVAVTSERYLVVCHPFRASSVCSTPRARRLVLVLFLAFVGLNAHFFWTINIVKYREPHSQCDPAHNNYEQLVKDVWPWVDALIYSLIPFVVILILNILIVRQVIIARSQRESLHGSHRYRQRRPSQEGSTRLTLMLLTISFAFLVTTLPMNVVLIASALVGQPKTLGLRSRFVLARTVAELLMYANHAINFYLYCATGQKFRHQLVWMICYARRTYWPTADGDRRSPGGSGGGGGGPAAGMVAACRDLPSASLMQHQLKMQQQRFGGGGMLIGGLRGNGGAGGDGGTRVTRAAAVDLSAMRSRPCDRSVVATDLMTSSRTQRAELNGGVTCRLVDVEVGRLS